MCAYCLRRNIYSKIQTTYFGEGKQFFNIFASIFMIFPMWINYFPSMILREAPKLWPDCEAPRFVPACKPMIASLARNVSSENSRRFSSAGRGPNTGPLYSGCLYVYLIWRKL